MGDFLNVGLIGLGTVSQQHLRVLSQIPDVKIKSVCDIKAASELKNVPEGSNFYNDFNEMLSNEKLDAVHIALPHYLHLEAATCALRHKVPVLLEKPMVMNGKEADALQDVVEKEGTLLAVCLQNRLNRTFLILQEYLATGRYGKVEGIKSVALWSRNAQYYESAPWRGEIEKSGGGCLINQAIHVLDQILLLGGKVQWVTASVASLGGLEISVEDSAIVKIGFDGGCSGLLMASNTNANNSSIELEVVTDTHIFRIKDFKLSMAKRTDEYNFSLICEDEILPGAKSYYGVGHTMLIQHFYEELRNPGKGWYVDVSEGSRSIKVLDAVYQSARKGGSKVNI